MPGFIPAYCGIWRLTAVFRHVLVPCSYTCSAFCTVILHSCAITHRVLLHQAASRLGVKKLLWGTDAPFAATQDSYGHLTDYLTQGGWTQEELDAIYYDNAAYVYFRQKEA